MTRADGPAAAARRALICAALALSAAAPAAACPATAANPAAEPELARSASAAGPRPAFDWFANGAAAGPRPDQAAIVLAVDRQRLGEGSWICSPAGSGMRSSCFER